jgi:hypothetical protein
MQRIIVFLGPSLERAAAETILPAEYRPPAKRGDLVQAVQDGAGIVGLVDGVFHQESAVAHREILAALRKGVKVVGASSMGALRAAEMDTLGMTGIGEVYRMYRTGELVSDDEVALVFDPETGYALSEPLVNIRFTLDAAEDRGIVTPEDHAALLAAARSVFYPQRTYAKIVAVAADAVSPDTGRKFLAWVKDHAVDQKRKDAVAALEYIRGIAGNEDA